jgi:hypothetical protein
VVVVWYSGREHLFGLLGLYLPLLWLRFFEGWQNKKINENEDNEALSQRGDSCKDGFN